MHLIMKGFHPVLLVLYFAWIQPCTAQSKASRIEVFKDFYQGSRGNCVYVATIKAGVMTFGIDSVFKKLDINKDSLITVTLRDPAKKIIQVTHAELQQARTACGFRKNTDAKPNRMYDLAIICYAVMAKVKSNEKQKFSETLQTMDKGEDVKSAFKYLGLGKYVTHKRPLTNTKGKCPIIVGNRKHAAYACYGDMDLWGKTKRLKWWLYWGRFEVRK